MEPNDSELMQRVCRGDTDAFAAIIDRYKDSLVNYLTRFVPSREQAEDVAQEAFIRLHRHAHQYRQDEKLAPYLFRIATNHLFSEMRREKRRNLLLLVFHRIPERVPSPYELLMADEVQRTVSEALKTLPPKLLAPLTLYEIEEWSYDDIACALECPIGTVKSRINRGRELMRRKLEGWWIGGHHEQRRNWSGDEAPAADERIATLHL